MDNKGWVYSSNKSFYSLVVGGICIFLGLVPLLSELGIDLSFIPLVIFHPIIIKLALVLGGLFLLYDSLSVGIGIIRLVSMMAGVVLAFVGALPLLIELKLLRFLPFIPIVDISPWMLEGVLLFFGLYLVVDAFVMMEYY